MTDLVPSTRLIDRDQDDREAAQRPVAVKTKTVTIADTTKTATVAFSVNGRVLAIITAAPNIPTDTTFDVAILDEDGAVIHDETGIADNGIVRTDIITDVVVCAGNTKVRVDFATDLSGDTVEIDVKLEYTHNII